MNATMSESSPTFLLIFYAFYFLFLGSMVLSALIPSIVAYFIEAFALYKLARKLGRKYAWLAWIPLCGVYFRVYVLADLAGQAAPRQAGDRQAADILLDLSGNFPSWGLCDIHSDFLPGLHPHRRYGTQHNSYGASRCCLCLFPLCLSERCAGYLQRG